MQKNNIEIEPKGSYFEIDKDGFLINPASLDKIQEKWKPVVSEIINAYKDHLGDHLKSVYLRGSVAKGQAVEYISDVDTFCFVDVPVEEIDTLWEKSVRNEIEKKFEFIEGVEFGFRTFANAYSKGILLNQAVCVYGESVATPKMKPDKQMMLHLPYLDERLGLVNAKIETANSEEKIKSVCIWFMKDMLRSGFELTMERSNRYTRDLYPCYKGFSEYYPDREAQMREILHFALNPTVDKEIIRRIRDEFVPWLIEESKKYI